MVATLKAKWPAFHGTVECKGTARGLQGVGKATSPADKAKFSVSMYEPRSSEYGGACLFDL
jgi:hypothetical protein